MWGCYPELVITPVFQPVNSQKDSTAQTASASSPQTVSSLAVSFPEAISSWEDSASKAASASSSQTVSCQAVSTDSKSVSTFASQAGSSWEDSTSQAASASSQTHSTNSQGASATLPQAPKLAGSPIVLILPRDLPELTHWKIPTLSGSSIYPVNL